MMLIALDQAQGCFRSPDARSIIWKISRRIIVETSKIFPGEVQDLWVKLMNSETTGAYFANRRTFSILYLKGIMIFDTRTGHFVSNREFIAVETPSLGTVARFGDYIARYIGFGNWP